MSKINLPKNLGEEKMKETNLKYCIINLDTYFLKNRVNKASDRRKKSVVRNY